MSFEEWNKSLKEEPKSFEAWNASLSAPTTILEKPLDPQEAYDQAGEIWDMSVELEAPLGEVKTNYSKLIEPPSSHGFIGTMPEPTAWQKFKNFFKGEGTQLPPNPDRMEIIDKYFKFAVGSPLRVFLKYGKGRMLNAPDILWAGLKRITPDDWWTDEAKNMTLDEAMDWAAGYNPSGFAKMTGEIGEFVGRIQSVAPIAQRVGIIGNTPKDINFLIKAKETALLFGSASAVEQIQKATSQIIDPSEAEYGFEGPKAVFRDMIIGAVFSMVSSGVGTVWKKLTPTEQTRALKVLGLKKGATFKEINTAARNLARKYHPDKVKGMEAEFDKVMKARNLLKQGEVKDIVFRGQKIKVQPKLIAGTAKQPPAAIEKRAVSPPEAKTPPAPAKIAPEAVTERPAGKEAQRLQVEEYLTIAKEKGEPISIYKNKKGDILVATEYKYGLSRVVVDKQGEIDAIGAGSVDTKKWKLISFKQLPSPPKAKQIYTSVPKEWRDVDVLYDWGQKGLRGVRKGEVAIKAEGQRARKTFAWRDEFEEIPTRTPKAIKALREKTDEVYLVKSRKGNYYLAPKKAIEEVKAELGDGVFERAPKPERSPLQRVNDRLNSALRQDLDEIEGGVGEAIVSLVEELGLKKEQLSDKIKGYIEEYENAKARGAIREDRVGAVEPTVPSKAAEEIEERKAIQEEHLAEEVGDFLDGLIEEKPIPKAKPIDLLGMEIYVDKVPPTDVPTKVALQKVVVEALNKDYQKVRQTKKKYKGIKDEKALYEKEFANRDELFIHSENPYPEMRAAWTIATKGKGLFGGEVAQFVEHIKKPSQKDVRAGKLEIPEPVAKMMESTAEKAKETAKNMKADIDKLRFYPNAPSEFRNDVRKDLIGALTKAHKNVFEDAQIAIWGKLDEKDIQKSVEIIFAKDQLSRAKLGKGNPEITVEQAKDTLDKVMKTASEDAIEAAKNFKTIHDAYTKKLIERGTLDKDQIIEDHIRHFVEDYTPEWAPTFGVPTRLKRPFRGYAKKAVGTTKEYRQDKEAILDSLMEMEHHNLVEDFIERQVAKYDIKPSMSREERIKQFGKDARGYAKTPRPNKIYIVDGKRYRGYTPDIPFSRTVYMTDDGEAAIGSFKNVAVIPEEIYNLFRGFSQRGGRATYLLNRATGYWKSSAILAHFPSFNVNNMVGDTWIALTQHPEPLKLLGEYDTAVKYLLGTLKEPYNSQLDKFIIDHDIKQTFAKAELMKGRKTKNPIQWLLRGSYNVSDFRESINRVAYASTLLREMQKGNGAKMVEAHNWIDTEGLSTEDALGKISREVLTDYQAVSKPFRRYVSGGVAPFGTFYFKTSARVWKWYAKHPIKGTIAFMALPIAATAYNSRNDKVEELESQLPDFVRHRTHFVLGENPDGTVRVLMLQFPQDVLIGTKIFSIATDYGNRVIDGEMKSKEAAVEMLKEWGIAEAEGLTYLLTPWARFFQGYFEGKDPYDNAPIYRREIERTTWDERVVDRALYFVKCSVPFLGYTIQNYEKGLPVDVGLRKVLDRFAGKGALGIYDMNKKAQIILEKDGKKTSLEYKDIMKTRKRQARTLKYLGRYEDDFVGSGKNPMEFAQSKKARGHLLDIYEMLVNDLPELDKIKDEDDRIKIVVESLDERYTNKLIGARVLNKWYRVKLDRAATDEEKRRIAEEYDMVRKMRLLETWKTLPKTEREIQLIKKIKELQKD